MPNIGTVDRTLRGIVALALVVCAFVAPLPPAVRILGFGLSAVYMLFTVLSGTCLGYRMLGMSTCPLERKP
jgi:hypothetical protein